MHESESLKSSYLNDDTSTILSTIKALEENFTSCISEEEFAEIFEPTCKLMPMISITKVYKYFHGKMKKADITKELAIDELDSCFAKKKNLAKDCKKFQNTEAWRPSGCVKDDLAVLLNQEQTKQQEKLDQEMHQAKLHLKTLLDQISYIRNKIEIQSKEIPELQTKTDGLMEYQKQINMNILNNNTHQEWEI